MKKLTLTLATGLATAILVGCGGGGGDTTTDTGTDTYDITLSGYAVDPTINGTLHIYLGGQEVATTPIENGSFSKVFTVDSDTQAYLVDNPIDLCVEGTDGTNTYNIDTQSFCVPVVIGTDLKAEGVVITPFHSFLLYYSRSRKTLSPEQQSVFTDYLTSKGINFYTEGATSVTEVENFLNSVVQAVESDINTVFGRNLTSVEWELLMGTIYTGVMQEPVLTFVSSSAQQISTPTGSMTSTCGIYNSLDPQNPVTENCSTFTSGAIQLAMIEGLYMPKYLYVGINNIYFPLMELPADVDPAVYPVYDAQELEHWYLNKLYGLPCDTGGDGAIDGDEAYLTNIRRVSCSFGTDSNGAWDGTVSCEVEGTVNVGLLSLPGTNTLPACSQTYTTGDKVYAKIDYTFVPFAK